MLNRRLCYDSLSSYTKYVFCSIAFQAACELNCINTFVHVREKDSDTEREWKVNRKTALTYRIPVHLITLRFHFRSSQFFCVCILFFPSLFPFHCTIFCSRFSLDFCAISLWSLFFCFLSYLCMVLVSVFVVGDDEIGEQILIEFCVGSAFTLMITSHILRALFRSDKS